MESNFGPVFVIAHDVLLFACARECDDVDAAVAAGLSDAGLEDDGQVNLRLRRVYLVNDLPDGMDECDDDILWRSSWRMGQLMDGDDAYEYAIDVESPWVKNK